MKISTLQHRFGGSDPKTLWDRLRGSNRENASPAPAGTWGSHFAPYFLIPSFSIKVRYRFTSATFR